MAHREGARKKAQDQKERRKGEGCALEAHKQMGGVAARDQKKRRKGEGLSWGKQRKG